MYIYIYIYDIYVYTCTHVYTYTYIYLPMFIIIATSVPRVKPVIAVAHVPSTGGDPGPRPRAPRPGCDATM